MKPQLLLLAIIAVAISSCTSAYRTGQTPDDVYFSPPRPQDEYVRAEENDDQYYRYDDQYYDDRYLRMKVQNRTQWDYLDDWYLYDRYSYSYNFYWGSYYNPYTSWNYYYNPYCRYNNIVIYNPKYAGTQNYVKMPRQFNLNTYTNTNYNNRNNLIKFSSIKPGMTSKPVYNNSNSSSGFGNTIKQIFNNLGGSTNSSGRSYSPSSSGGSSGSSSGSGGGGVSRPSRGGN